MYGKAKYSPHCFIRGYIPSSLKALNFIVSVLVSNTKNGHVLPLMNVFTDVLDALNGTTNFDVDVRSECSQKKWIVGNDPSVVNCMPIYLSFDPVLIGGASSVLGISVCRGL